MGRKARLKETRKLEAPSPEEQALEQRAGNRRKLLLVAIPVVTLALVALFWFVVKSRFGVGLTALVGAVAWIGLLAQGAAEGVEPTDRDGASRIDFGNRR